MVTHSHLSNHRATIPNRREIPPKEARNLNKTSVTVTLAVILRFGRMRVDQVVAMSMRNLWKCHTFDF